MTFSIYDFDRVRPEFHLWPRSVFFPFCTLSQTPKNQISIEIALPKSPFYRLHDRFLINWLTNKKNLIKWSNKDSMWLCFCANYQWSCQYLTALSISNSLSNNLDQFKKASVIIFCSDYTFLKPWERCELKTWLFLLLISLLLLTPW